MNVAVADSAGNLVAFQRMDGAMLASIQIAEHKARAIAANLDRRAKSEPFSPFESKLMYNSADARNAVEHNCARLAVARLGRLNTRTGNEISAT